MYERFTDRSRKVMQLANQEAQRFNHEHVGTEHILLGLIKEGSGVAANVLKNLDVDLRQIRLEIEKLIQSGPDMVTMGKLPHTPLAKRVLEYVMEEARNLNVNYYGTEHVLLGLLRERDGVAYQVLTELGLNLEGVREETQNLLSHGLVDTPRSTPDSEERFTPRACKVLQLANQEAQRFNHEYIGTEHILLGLVKEGSGNAANALKFLNVELRKIRDDVEELVQSGPDMITMGKLPRTPRAKKAIEYAKEEARILNHDYYGTEHLLLGILRNDEGVPVQVLMNLGIKLEDLRDAVRNLVGHLVTRDESSLGPDPWDRNRSVSTRPRAPSPPRRASLDPGEGQDHQLAALPEDVDYIQHLAAELAMYCGKRESQAAEDSPEETLPEVIEFEEEIEKIKPVFDDAVANQDFEKAAGLRDQMDRLKIKKKEFLHVWRNQAVQEKAETEAAGSEPVSLSEFSQLHLSLFNAENAIKQSEFVDAATIVEEVNARINGLIEERIAEQTENLIERLEFISDSVDQEKAQVCRAELEALKSDDSGSLKDRVDRFDKTQEEITHLISDRPKLVFKVNVFAHGTRDLLEIKDGDTVETLQGWIKEKYADAIGEYLYRFHDQRIPMTDVRVRVFSDGSETGDADADLDAQTLLIDIPSHDTEGVTWYPEWSKSESSIYQQEHLGADD